MSLGATISAYRSNFRCKKGSASRPYKTTFKVKLIDLFIDYYRETSQYEDDLFIGIAQWLMKKGLPNRTNALPYPYVVHVGQSIKNIDIFLKKSLFSRDHFFAENLFINANNFDLIEWRRQFDLFSETKIEGLKYYRNRPSTPIPNFRSFDCIKKEVFTNRNFYNGEVNCLKFSPNECHPEAIWILKKCCFIYQDKFVYTISYGYKEDFDNAKADKAHSSWDIKIESEINENYIDFCLRLYQNYEGILSGKSLVQQSKHGEYYLLTN